MHHRFGLVGILLTAIGMLGAGPLYLVDDTHVPTVKLAWTTTEGKRIEYEAERPYASKYDRTFMGNNVECFVAVGGSRIDKGCGHPEGLVIRVGFYKLDSKKLFFEGLGAEGSLHIELHNIVANKSGRPIPQTVLQHLQYTRDDVEACGLGRKGQDQYNTLHPDERLLGQISEDNARLGSLDGDTEHGHAKFEFVNEDDGSLTMIADLPYPLLRHVKDPWVRPVPGLFLEPQHFHIEFEMLPDGVEPRPLVKPETADSSSSQ
jgi:hypothetical protein